MSDDFLKNITELLIRLNGAEDDLNHLLYRHARLEQYRKRLQESSDLLFELFEPLSQYCSILRTSLPTVALADQRIIFVF